MSHRVDACRECFQRNASRRFQRSSQQSQSQSNRSIKSLARSCGRRTRRFGRTPRAKTIERTNERANERTPSALRPSVRPSRSKPTHEGTNRVEFRVARARSVRRLVDDRAIDRSTTTETRDGNPRDTARASTCARRARPRPCVRVVQPSTHCLHTQHTPYLSLFPLLSNHEPSITPIYVYTRAQPDVRLSVGRAVGANPARRIDRAFSRFDPRWVKLENTRCRSREGSPARQRATGRDAVVG